MKAYMGPPVNVLIRSKPHLLNVTPANDTKESMFLLKIYIIFVTLFNWVKCVYPCFKMVFVNITDFLTNLLHSFIAQS